MPHTKVWTKSVASVASPKLHDMIMQRVGGDVMLSHQTMLLCTIPYYAAEWMPDVGGFTFTAWKSDVTAPGCVAVTKLPQGNVTALDVRL